MLQTPASRARSCSAQARSKLLAQAPLPLPRDGGGTGYEHLKAWGAALAADGVLLMTTVGGRVETSEMRGFFLYFDEVPVVILHGSDAAWGRLFSPAS